MPSLRAVYAHKSPSPAAPVISGRDIRVLVDFDEEAFDKVKRKQTCLLIQEEEN